MVNSLIAKLSSIPMIGKQFAKLKIGNIERLSLERFDTGDMWNNLVDRKPVMGDNVFNITGNTFMGEEDMAEKVGDKIIKKLQLSTAI
jgi:hypothetical protein